MSLPFYYYLLGTPLGLLGLIRWGAWLIRRIPAVAYKPVVNDHRASMSIVVPTYQEDPQIFAAAIESWLANDVDEVILVIDSSDTVCQDIAARYPAYGSLHGFDVTVPVTAGAHSVCVYGINDQQNSANPQLGCMSATAS